LLDAGAIDTTDASPGSEMGVSPSERIGYDVGYRTS
jgi:hypothetical protein